MRRSYVMVGAAGYVAPKHMKAIKDTGGQLLAVYDISDSVGILDRYFPECLLFTRARDFGMFVNRVKPDYLVVCTPNDLHALYCNYGLSAGMDVICEKPITIDLKELQELQEREIVTGKRVWGIAQMRLHPAYRRIVYNVQEKGNKFHLQYTAPRGAWYEASWKGDISRSGGLIFNIGVHMIDLLCTLFGGEPEPYYIHKERYMVTGRIEFSNADGRFTLSIRGDTPVRTLTVNGQSVNFNPQFGDLHGSSYRRIHNGDGFGIETLTPAIKLCSQIRDD